MTAPTFRCGHPRTEANTYASVPGKAQCRACHRQRAREWHARNYARKAVPEQIKATQRKLEALLDKAARMGAEA